MNYKFYLPATLLICAVILAAWYQFVYESARLQIASMELETQQLSAVEREIAKLKARHGDLATLVDLKEQQLDAALTFLPPTLAQDEFIDALYRAADGCGAQIISVRTGEETSAKELQSQVVSVRAEANYIPLLNFIRVILDGERLTRLERFSVETSGKRLLHCELNFRIFATNP